MEGPVGRRKTKYSRAHNMNTCAYYKNNLHYVEPPSCIKIAKGKVLKLKKALYGLKQASMVWNHKLDAALLTYGLRRSKLDPCIYYHINGERMTFLALYVDDMLLFSNDEKYQGELKSKLMSDFKMKFLGKAKQCLGMRITRNDGNIYLDQENYIDGMLRRYNMENCNPISTPMDMNQKLCKEVKIDKSMENVPYQQAIGSLLFAAQCTRPDICQAVNYLSRFNNNPNQSHWKAVKRVFRYLKGTRAIKLKFTATGNKDIITYSDSDWANDVEERRSVTGYVNILQEAAISWNSKRQPTVALSTTEAEYMALSASTQEVVWLRELSNELDMSFNINHPTKIFCDNQSAVHLASNDAYHPRSKHIDIRHHFVREKKKQNTVEFCGVSTDMMLADFFTKPVCLEKHKYFCKHIGLTF